MNLTDKSIAILGGGNIGQSIALGLAACKHFAREKITITRRNIEPLQQLKSQGFAVENDNIAAVKNADLVIIAVTPLQLADLLKEIATELDAHKHIAVSVVSGIKIADMQKMVTGEVPIIRAMPNTAIAICQSMTCLAASDVHSQATQQVQQLFNFLGKTHIIAEELMEAATALCACGLAFFLRAIRAASQGGIEIGFHAEEAITMAAQTAKGAASLLLEAQKHPEREIDKVTTPRGITITGLNEMEHQGFSSAFIKGITTSARKATGLGPIS